MRRSRVRSPSTPPTIRQRPALPGLLLLPFLLLPFANALAWGQEGHSITAEIAQRRLTPEAAATVERLLGRGASLASVASWADDIRDERPETYNWHFVDIPVKGRTYDPRRHCKPAKGGDCVVAELARLRNELRCATTDELKKDALRYAVHFVGDVHQPLHTVADARGGNSIMVDIEIHELKCARKCQPLVARRNFHAVWDETLIASTTWNWGAYVERLERGWLKTDAARGVDGGNPLDWALETHAAAKEVWNLLPPTRAIDDGYYRDVLPVVDRQLGLAGLRLARFLNEAYSSGQCPVP